MTSTTPANARRFYMVDLDFFHKSTCDKLFEKFGPGGPLVFLALVAEAKRSRPPGTLTVTGELDFWKLLGFYGRDLGFTMDEFLAFTGTLKQTSRTTAGRLLNVQITHFSEWQNDWKRETERTRKARLRAQNERDSEGTGAGQARDRELDLDLYPQSPPNGGRENRKATPSPRRLTHPFICPTCGCDFKLERILGEHLEIVHDVQPRDLEDALAAIREGRT